jgi:mRNA interferase MazF
VILVPFPFTDLSGGKQRPALVVSPAGFHDADVVLCAISSRVPQRLSPWELPLDASDVVERRLPKPSVIQVGKLFTIHRGLIRARFGRVRGAKLAEVLGRLQALFKEPAHPA